MKAEELESMGWKIAETWVKEQVVWIEPLFVHDIGDRAHHMSMMRTCETDEDGQFIKGTGPSSWRFTIHEALDDFVFYPLRDWMSNWIGDNDIYSFLRTLLGFFWGLNCGFPPRDVALYTLWSFRGCHREKLALKI